MNNNVAMRENGAKSCQIVFFCRICPPVPLGPRGIHLLQVLSAVVGVNVSLPPVIWPQRSASIWTSSPPRNRSWLRVIYLPHVLHFFSLAMASGVCFKFNPELALEMRGMDLDAEV